MLTDPAHPGHPLATCGGTPHYAAQGLPPGLPISPSTGLISGTISSSLTAGIYDTTVTVTDGTHTAKKMGTLHTTSSE